MKWDLRGGLTAISAGYVPSGIAFGAIATALHVPVWATISLSALVYSGAVQSAFVGFWSIGIELSCSISAIHFTARMWGASGMT